jgi:CubicO group peptidase (beta-lactamase class C family)
MRLFLLHVLWTTIVNAGCYEPNVAHPLPEYDTEDPVLHGAFGLIETALSTAVGDPDFVDTSFSVEVTSSKETIWSHHHTALTRNTSGPDIPEVNGDALYRIASITKTFTVLGILYLHKAGKISLDDTIDTYIEEFKGEEYGNLPWKDITLRSLASQLSGLPRECMPRDHRCRSLKGNVADSIFSCSK